MTTKSGKLQLQEKRRIEELIKCGRDRKRGHLLEKLTIKRQEIEKAYDERIAKIEVEKTDAVRLAGYSKLYERGCYDVHPDLDKFDAETNEILMKLWERQE